MGVYNKGESGKLHIQNAQIQQEGLTKLFSSIFTKPIEHKAPADYLDAYAEVYKNDEKFMRLLNDMTVFNTKAGEYCLPLEAAFLEFDGEQVTKKELSELKQPLNRFLFSQSNSKSPKRNKKAPALFISKQDIGDVVEAIFGYILQHVKSKGYKKNHSFVSITEYSKEDRFKGKPLDIPLQRLGTDGVDGIRDILIASMKDDPQYIPHFAFDLLYREHGNERMITVINKGLIILSGYLDHKVLQKYLQIPKSQ